MKRKRFTEEQIISILKERNTPLETPDMMFSLSPHGPVYGERSQGRVILAQLSHSRCTIRAVMPTDSFYYGFLVTSVVMGFGLYSDNQHENSHCLT